MMNTQDSFNAALKYSYGLIFRDFGNFETFKDFEFFLFVVFSLFLTLVLMNVTIAVVLESFQKIRKNSVSEQAR